MFKSQQNESPYSKRMTVTERVFTKWTLAWKLLVQNWYSELHDNSTVCLIVDFMWQNVWRPAVVCKRNFLDFETELTILLRNSEKWRLRLKVQFIVADIIKIFWLTVNAVWSARSQFTLSPAAKPTEKISVKVLRVKQENQFMLQNWQIDHRQPEWINSYSW